jgi:hypothetical protein
MKVHPSQTGEVTAARTAHAAGTAAQSTSSASFASVLASTTTEPVQPRKGETMSPVSGHAYAEISGGKRDGLYVNTSHNKRHGQAFVLVHKHGREYHVYGTGKDRLVVALRKPDHDAAKPPATAPASTGGATPTVSAS